MKGVLRKSGKYLLICVANLALLTTLLALWTDDLETTFHPFSRPIGFLAVLGFCLLSGMVVLIAKGRNAIVLTLAICSYLYVAYGQRAFSNYILHGAFRERLAEKIKLSTGLANGTEAAGLTNQEYQAIAALADFPPLPSAAGNIRYAYQFDGFLPDYSFSLSYDLPAATPVAIYDSSWTRHIRFQSVEQNGPLKRVTYCEGVN